MPHPHAVKATTRKPKARPRRVPAHPTLDGLAASVIFPQDGPAIVRQTHGARFARVSPADARRVMASGGTFTTAGASFGWAKGV